MYVVNVCVPLVPETFPLILFLAKIDLNAIEVISLDASQLICFILLLVS
jgi:hypothetical protein